jgi:hypothetical protein
MLETPCGIDAANKEKVMGDNDGAIAAGMFFKTAIDNFARAAGLTPLAGDTKYDQAAAIVTGLQLFCAGMRDAYGSKAGPTGQMFFRNAIDNFDRAGRLYDPARDTIETRLAIVATALQQFCAGTREALSPRP